MSGIAGVFRLRGAARSDADGLVRRMLAVMAHRGAGHSLIRATGRAVLGQCGAGPGAAADAGRIRAVLDGQVYNAQPLRLGLRFAGRPPHGEDEAELLALCVEQDGPEGLKQVNGRFAVALWDERVDRLTLARDRLGKKPLYYLVHDELLLFASEIKALTAAVPFHRGLDPVALQQYLTCGFVAPPLTMFRGVGKLGAGEALVVEPGGSFRRIFWWQPGRDARQVLRLRHLPGAALDDAVRSLVECSVADRVCPGIGCLIDGSRASLALGGLAARMLGRPLDTVMVHGDEVRPDRFGDLPVHPVAVAPHHVAGILPDLVRHLDEPLADMAAPFAWFGARALAARGASAVLTGDGAAELLPRAATAPGLLARLAPWLGARDASGGPFAAAESYRLIAPGIAGAARRAAAAAMTAARPEAPAWLPSGAEPMLRALRGRLPEARLMRADKTAMAHGLEPRAPLLDHQVVDALLMLSDLRAARPVLRQRLGLGRIAPPAGAVLGSWLRGPLGGHYEDVLRRARLCDDGVLDRGGCLELLRRHRADGRQGGRLWAVLMLAEWYDLFWVSHGDSARPPSLPRMDHSAAAE